ncbi:3519_t:CDS:2 [Gigaspora margarita]|uniref:3519_t:CDS:1 n=1 Tax=Gigaspora margarita TaxID=4874 RepID=A0ABN7UI81_GIGMA|nr:3519_t:CDS:2 [Gigaspora margarita]
MYQAYILFKSEVSHVTTHIMDLIKAALRLENTDLAVIPGGLTSITKKKNLKHADLKTVCNWVLKAWEDISEDVIICAFKKCGISNCLSGSEDHLIYDDDNKNNSNENSDNNESEVEEKGSNKELDENEEFDKNDETGDENKEFNKNNETGDEMEKWPECYIIEFNTNEYNKENTYASIPYASVHILQLHWIFM